MTLNQKVAHIIRQRHGWELTPDEIGRMRQEALAKLRKYLSDKGHTPPESDHELMMLIRGAIRDIPPPEFTTE